MQPQDSKQISGESESNSKHQSIKKNSVYAQHNFPFDLRYTYTTSAEAVLLEWVSYIAL